MFRLNPPVPRCSNSGGSPDRRTRVPGARRLVSALSVLAAVALLAACGSSGNSPDHRIFANNPAQQTIPATATAPPTQAAPPTPTPTPPASPAALLAARGAAARFYVAIGGRLLVIDGKGSANQLPLPAHSTLLGFDWSPDGGQVAVAIGQRDAKARDRSTVSLLVLTMDGKTTRTVANLLTIPLAGATPAGGVAAPQVMVDWGLVGNQIAVATSGGALVLIPATGGARTVPLELKGQTIRAMRISPRGDTASLLTVDAAGRGTVVMVSLGGGKPQAPNGLVGFAVDHQHSVTDFTWVSDGQHLLFTQANPGSNPLTGGELYLLDAKTRDVRLVDTGGRAGPAAGIIGFAPSPDGKTVAYLIGTPEGSSWMANSLWVRSLRGAGLYQVPIGNAEEIDGLWWTAAGLVWVTRVAASDGYEMLYFLQPPNGPAHELVRVTVKQGAPGTPGATPVASPVASPIASPASSPISTRVATPSG